MRSLKAYLIALVVAVVLPGVLFGLGASWWLAAEMRAKAEQDAERLVEAVAGDIAEYIRLVISAMNVLGRSPALHGGNLADTYRFAAQLAADLDQHIGVSRPDGTQLFNTRRPFGTALPRRSDPRSYTRAVQTGQPSVSNVIIGAVTRTPLISIDLPVTTVLGPLILGTSTDVAAIGAVLARTKLARGWVAGVIDADGIVIAHSPLPEDRVGRPAPPEVIAAAASGRSAGVFPSRGDGGAALISFFRKVPGTNWMVLVGTPESVLHAPRRGPMALLIGAGLGAIALTIVVAALFGGRLHRAASRLGDAALALGRGEEPPTTEALAEFDKVAGILRQASRLIREKEDALRAAKVKAELSAEAKARFFAAASHDLRQPLQASRLFLDTLRPTVETPQQQRLVDHLETAQTAMADLVGALLDIARMDAGTLVSQSVPVELAGVVAQIVAECRPLAELKGLRLRHRGGGAVILTDRLLLARILRNLIHNAIRYSESGGILVACRRRGGALSLEVWDSGVGIAPDQLALIWEEFYQVGNSCRDRAHGLGLGLAIVRRLTRILGYQVEVRSRPGQGSVFRVAIPLAAAVEAPPGLPAMAGAVAPGA